MTIAKFRPSAILRAQAGLATIVPHLTLEDVQRVAAAALGAAHSPRRGQRDALLILTMFDACLRVSAALQLTPASLQNTPTGWLCSFIAKGGKYGQAAISPSLVSQLMSYAYTVDLDRSAAFWPVNRHQAFQIVKRAFDLAAVIKPPGVGHNHILRHSGAIARLAATGNPKAVQDQLGHVTAAMTLRYLKTLSAQESMEIQKGVDFGW